MDSINALKYALMPRVGFTFSRSDESTTGVLFNDSGFREDARVMLPAVTSFQNDDAKSTQHSVIDLKHSYFSTRVSMNVQKSTQNIFDTTHGVILDMSSPITFRYQIWTSVLLHPECTVPPQL